MVNSELVVQQTQQWLEEIVIGLNFCPFAKNVFNTNAIEYVVDTSISLEDCLGELVAQFKRLDKQPEIETSLIIYTENFLNFNDYLDYLDVANQLLVEEGYEGQYQLASFHPNYCFEGSQKGDVENFTNISPYPMLHLLREQRLEEALQYYPNPENIPSRNMEVARQHGIDYFKVFLSKIKKA